MGNSNLHRAKKAKCNEFYTQLIDIERELRYYDFGNKVVTCNCDNPDISNFYKYFKLNFHYLKLKKLICTGYNANGNGYYATFDGETEVIGKLQGDGDFRSAECIEYLKECDVVVTNPPFSLFREYVAQLMEYGKKFLIIGNKNAITYKEIFPYIKNDMLWLGIATPDEYRLPNGEITQSVKGLCRWFTNINNKRRNEPLDLYRKYSPEYYPKYDNYDAIEVSKVADIPMDYRGCMGVPITFLDKYCPSQFEIIGLMSGAKGENLTNGNDNRAKFYINGKDPYARILIRRKSFN